MQPGMAHRPLPLPPDTHRVPHPTSLRWVPPPSGAPSLPAGGTPSPLCLWKDSSGVQASPACWTCPHVGASPCRPSGLGHSCPWSASQSPRLCFAWLPPFTSGSKKIACTMPSPLGPPSLPSLDPEATPKDSKVACQHIWGFCYQEVADPQAALARLKFLCHQWLWLEVHSTEQIFKKLKS